MSGDNLGRRYADGLYEAAKSKGVVSEVVEGMQTVEEVYAASPEFAAFWGSPQVSPKAKHALVDKAFAKLPELVRNLLKTLVDRKREPALPALCRELHVRHDEETGVVRATLTTAVEVTEEEAAGFVELLQHRLSGKVLLRRKTDESLIAGFRLRFGDQIIDASVSRSLEEMKRAISA